MGLQITLACFPTALLAFKKINTYINYTVKRGLISKSWVRLYKCFDGKHCIDTEMNLALNLYHVEDPDIHNHTLQLYIDTKKKQWKFFFTK